MQTLSEIKALLAEAGLSPRMQFGQNFLVDHNHLRGLLAAADVRPGERILEVGPGTGTLTEELLARGCRVVAAEIDRGLCALLRRRLGADPGFTLVEGDCLDRKCDLAPGLAEAIGAGPCRLIANLPYACATPLMLTLLLRHPLCTGMWVTVQREVAQRLEAGPGSEAYGAISVIAGAIAEVRRLGTLSGGCFWPPPRVTSAMIQVTRRTTPLTGDWEALEAVVRLAFAHRRKQLASAFGPGFPWPEGVRPSQRGEELTPEQFCAMAVCWRASMLEGSQTTPGDAHQGRV
ncbi:MAG: ribosomal RNA small subunit methyltransferase A [Phycisphaerales bacterium]|nr:ribosomal RNA small subunit methyltransferase A [Phycisphaerales bacterium]